MLDKLAHLFLTVTSEYFVIAFISVGYLTYRRQIFARALFILLFTMLLNPFLKALFEIPLTWKEGWAFPSGHMQTTTALWGWLLWEMKNKAFTVLALFVMGAVAWSMLYLGYHTPFDLFGAVGFGLLTLIIYGLACHFLPEERHPYLGVFMAAIGLLLIYFTPENLPHMWIAQGALVGFSLGWAIYHTWDTQDWIFKRRFTVASAFAGIFILYLVTLPLSGLLPPEGFNFVRFFAVAFWVSHGAEALVFYVHRWMGRL